MSRFTELQAKTQKVVIRAIFIGSLVALFLTIFGPFVQRAFGGPDKPSMKISSPDPLTLQ